MAKTWALLVWVGCLGCATALSPAAAKVRDADRHDVRGCEFLGVVEGSSLQTGVAVRDTGAQNARNGARERAAELGADFLVWSDGSSSAAAIVAQAEAYRCAR